MSENSIGGFGQDSVQKVKKLLAAGVALAGQMNTEAGTQDDANKF